mmetsp:Transcript_54603/g.114072  ORF Transcript_54603/g.114072 Transcript_54603/m.114072 type:complete len:200 (+) Transcript_54603:2249-2848(+)
MHTLMHFLRVWSPEKCCLARVLPSTTGSTASRWEGLGQREMWIMRPGVCVGRSIVKPRWYLTSPLPRRFPVESMAAVPSMNSKSISSKGLRMTLARTLRRPRWGMPMSTDSTPSSTARSMSALRPGMRASTPSSPKRFVVLYFVARKDSKVTAKVRRSSRRSVALASYSNFLAFSNLDRIQFCCVRSAMCVNSTPTVPQ